MNLSGKSICSSAKVGEFTAIIANNIQKGGKPMLEGKKIIILGDRDGIPGGAIEKCLENIDLEIVLSTTECFV